MVLRRAAIGRRVYSEHREVACVARENPVIGVRAVLAHCARRGANEPDV